MGAGRWVVFNPPPLNVFAATVLLHQVEPMAV